jgi:hypothetical protein
MAAVPKVAPHGEVADLAVALRRVRHHARQRPVRPARLRRGGDPLRRDAFLFQEPERVGVVADRVLRDEDRIEPVEREGVEAPDPVAVRLAGVPPGPAVGQGDVVAPGEAV